MGIHWERNHILSAARLNAQQPVSRRKLRTDTKVNDNSLGSDNELRLQLRAGLTYDLFGLLIHSSAANAAGDFQCAVGWSPWNATGTWSAWGTHTSIASGTQDGGNWDVAIQDASSPTTGIGFGSSTTPMGVRVRGRIIVDDQDTTCTILWAQIAANANLTSFHLGSWFTAIPVL